MLTKLKYGLIIILAAGFFHPNALHAQKDLKAWGAVSFQIPAGKKITFGAEYLRAYNATKKWENEFNQAQGRLGIRMGRNIDIFIGDIVTLAPGSDAIKNRVFVRGAHKIKLGEIFRLQNAMQAELHSKNESRYQYRFIVSSRINIKKRFSALQLAPSVTGFIFYNIGGKELQYYDDNKQPIVKQSPDGFHRTRLLFNLNSKISSHFNISLYYMMQREFNFLNDRYHSINYNNPVNGKIIRPFDNYNVAGITLGINLINDNISEPVINNN